MLTPDPDRERPAPQRSGNAKTAPSLHASDGIAAFRRGYRWLNLTLVQHGVWPLLVIVVSAPQGPVGLTPLPWYWARLAAPALAALLAVAYLRQRVPGAASDAAVSEPASGDAREHRLREQVTVLFVGVAAAVALLRLLQGPVVPVLKVEAYGLADVAAYQLINFGVAGRGSATGWARALPILLFGVSWGLHELFHAGTTPAGGNPLLAFAGGAAVGLAVAAVVWGLRRWPGGSLSGAAFQFLVVSLVLGFLA
jgi:hypothetical protein